MPLRSGEQLDGPEGTQRDCSATSEWRRRSLTKVCFFMAGRCLVCSHSQMRETADLLTILHTQTLDIPRAVRIAAAAGVACADNDVEHSRLYLDLISIFFEQNAPEAFEATMNSLGYEYQSDFARRYYGQGKAEGQMEGWAKGKAEGKAEGRIEIILKLLALRFGPLTEAAQTRVRGAQDAQLDAVAERMLTAKTLEEAVSQLF
jgi:hypothetical protein